MQIGTFIGQFKSLFKYLEKKKSSTLQVHDISHLTPKIDLSMLIFLVLSVYYNILVFKLLYNINRKRNID